MDEYLILLEENGILFGEYSLEKVSGLSPQWFWDRQIDFLDFRGDLQIRSTECLFGRHIRLITASHSIVWGKASPGMAKKHVWIEKNTFIGSYSLLYNCHIGEQSVVSCGSVVSNVIVPPYTMVEGNPARMIGRFINGFWVRIECPPYAGENGKGMRYWEIT